MEKILIVDDSLLQATRLKDILEDEYDITIAQTAEDGLYHASTEKYSLILLDVVLFCSLCISAWLDEWRRLSVWTELRGTADVWGGCRYL